MALTPFGTTVVECVFKDREREAEFRLRFPFSTSFEDAAAIASVIANAAQAVSNGLLVRITVRKNYADRSAGEASLASKTTRKMMLYYRNETSYEAIAVPSGREDLLEATGQYAGVRADTLNPELAAALGALSLALVPVRTPEDAPFPTDYVVGGIGK